MISFLLFIMIVAVAIFCYTLNQKLTIQKNQLKITSKQNRELKTKINRPITNQQNIIINFKPAIYKKGTAKIDCKLYIAPMESSAILDNVAKDTDLIIQDSAEISSSIWYEVKIDKSNNINNKGWIKKENIVGTEGNQDF